jgi:hypothetical protein
MVTEAVTEAINTAMAAGAKAESILVRGDSAYCAGTVVAAVVNAGATFSFVIARNPPLLEPVSSSASLRVSACSPCGAVLQLLVVGAAGYYARVGGGNGLLKDRQCFQVYACGLVDATLAM